MELSLPDKNLKRSALDVTGDSPEKKKQNMMHEDSEGINNLFDDPCEH